MVYIHMYLYIYIKQLLDTLSLLYIGLNPDYCTVATMIIGVNISFQRKYLYFGICIPISGITGYDIINRDDLFFENFPCVYH